MMPLSSLYNGPNFLLPSHSSQNQRRSIRSESDVRPSPAASTTSPDPSPLWPDKYAPRCEEELGVRKQKLDEIKRIITHSAIAQRRGDYKLLVLTGPAGIGKSTAVKVLAGSMGYDLIEWKNYQQQLFDQSGYFDPDYEPVIDKFAQFLHRAIHSSNLSIAQHPKPRIILLDDLPDLTTPFVKQKFQSLLESYIQSNHAFLMVIVHSEAQMDAGFGRQHRYSSRETRLTTLYDIATQHLRNSRRCEIVELKPVIRTKLKSVLSKILRSEALSGNRHSVSSQQVEEIIDSCHGDIRCAILTMQFCSVRPALLTGKRKLDSDPQDASSVNGRVHNLEFFHAVGKVLYAKRTPSGTLESKPTNILKYLNTDSDRYLGTLFSHHPSMMTDIHDVSKTLNYMCEGDMISGMGAWNDDVPLEYQLLISMHAIMATKRTPNAASRRLEFSSPGGGYFRQRCGAKNESPRIVTPIVSASQETMSSEGMAMESVEYEGDDDDDILADIGSFSDDEFDDIYGDGDDLSLIDCIP